MFASKEDIQTWLTGDKVPVDDANSAKPNLEAMRTIRGQLTGTFSVAVINTWADPDTTPELIRSIAGRLAAAFLYRALYSEDSTEVTQYGQALYNEAMSMMMDIKSGVLTVVDADDVAIDAEGSVILGFWPNDNSPVFTMGQDFA